MAGACGSETGEPTVTSAGTAPVADTSGTGEEVPELQVVRDDELDARTEALRAGGPGGVLLTIAGADGVLRYGADGPASGEELGPESLLRVGSVTKPVVAAAVLCLVDQGALGLDDSASGHVSRVAIPDDVTVRHLLANRSGVADFVELVPELVSDPARVWSPEELIEPALLAGPVFEPGSEFQYSNTNYLVLGVLVEEATGTSLDDALRELVTGPLGMESTFLGGDGEPPDVVPAAGQGDMPYTAIASAAWAAGGLVSDAVDLGRFATGVFGGALLPATLLEEMTGDPEGDGYGLGLYDEGDGRFGHGGGVPGYRVQLTHDARSGATVFVATNDDGIDFSPVLPDLYAEAR